LLSTAVQDYVGATVQNSVVIVFQSFMDEHSLYAHTRAHELHYSTQRSHRHAPAGPRGHSSSSTMQTACVQMAIPDTTCPEDQRTTAPDVTSVSCAAAEPGDKRPESLEMLRKNIEMSEQRKNIEMGEPGDLVAQRSAAKFDVRIKSKKASILRRLSAGLPLCLSLSLSL